MLNDCYKYAAAINAKGQSFPAEPLIMALLLSQHQMIDWLTKEISKHESVNNEVKQSNEAQSDRQDKSHYIRKNAFGLSCYLVFLPVIIMASFIYIIVD